jgi:predicted dehydrogenase
MIHVGVIGYGYWGPNFVRNFQELPGATVDVVCDSDPARLAVAQKRYPHLRATRDAEDLLRNPALDLVAVMTPISTHFNLTKAALEAGKHVVVAKPLATSLEEAVHLVTLADQRRRMLAVDHTFVYTPAVRKIREIIAGGELGEVYYYDSTRVNLGLIQHDVNVVWDLATHDVSILDYLFDDKPVSVAGRAVSHIGSHETIAYLFIRFAGSLVAHLHVNWLDPQKVRMVFVGGSQKMIVYDDNEPSEKVKVYDRGVLLNATAADRGTTLVQYRTGDLLAPHIPTTEALQVECQHLLECIREGTTPLTGGAHALNVVRLLEAAQRSIRQDGREVRL